jgi:hypothetical protein
MRLAKAGRTSPLLVAVLLVASPAYAQDPCLQEFKWTDAIHAKRIGEKDGHFAQAEFTSFANASVLHLTLDSNRAGLIKVLGAANGPSVQLTYGGDKLGPDQFSEISMIVEPPMARGDWPRLPRPCAIAEGVTIAFNQDDQPATSGHSAQGPKFYGTLQRRGLQIIYSMSSEDGETSRGELRYGRDLKDIDPQTDVSGWNVFHDKSYVEKLPEKSPIPLRAVLERSLRRADLPPAR